MKNSFYDVPSMRMTKRDTIGNVELICHSECLVCALINGLYGDISQNSCIHCRLMCMHNGTQSSVDLIFFCRQ